MAVDDYYNLELFINNEIADLAPASYTFDLEDSIHMMYPRLNMYLSDTTGLMQEYFATGEGLQYQLEYGRLNETVKSKYVVMADSLPETLSAGVLNGTVKVELIHDYFDTQTIISNAYNNRISIIVRNLADKYRFRSINVNDTGNQRVWYQPMMNDVDFIEKILLPNAYSSNGFNSPFFCFVGLDNSFNFRNFKSMFDSSPVEEIYLSTQTQESTQDPNLVRSISRVHVGADTTKKYRSREFFTINKDNGELITNSYSITDIPSSIRTVPIIDTSDNLQSYYFQGSSPSSPTLDQDIIGDRNNSMRGSLFLDRFVVELSLNTNLRAGRVVNLDIRTFKDIDGDQDSLAFRGKYLIENSKHAWFGPSQTGTTRLLISRKQVNAPSTYFAAKRFIGA